MTDTTQPGRFMSLAELSKVTGSKITEDRALKLGLTIIHREKLGRYNTAFVEREAALIKAEELARTAPRDFEPTEMRLAHVQTLEQVKALRREVAELNDKLTQLLSR